MTSERARRKMARARSELVLEHPFFANLALRLTLREDEGCRTAWSDGRVLAYNPAYIESMPLEKVKGMQCHEVLHLACRHHTRRNDRDPKIWNKACDLAINPVLLEAGIELPTGYLDDPAYYGKSADAIYAILVDRDEESKGGALDGPGQEVDPEEDIEKSAGDQNEEEKWADPGDDYLDADQGRDQDDDPGMSGEVRDAPESAEGRGGKDGMRSHEQEWKASVAQALNKSREAGDLHGGLERLVSEALSPGIGWRELLRRFFSQAAKNDFTWVRPNRRYLHTGLYLPGLHNEEPALIAVAVDVSGSIGQHDLDAFASELSALLEECDATLIVFTCDAAVTTKQSLGKCDLPLHFEAAGGGGTDFRPPFESLRRDGVIPACFIYFTDLVCSSFPEDPGFPVLWITQETVQTPPPFGEVVHMEIAA